MADPTEATQANPNVLMGADGKLFDPLNPEVSGEVVVQTTSLDPFYDIRKFTNQNLLRSSKFAVRFNSLPAFLPRASDLRKFTYLCDSIEFPGQTLTTTDYRMAGRLKLKVPYAREINEVNLSFYFDNSLPLYSIMNSWIYEVSSTSDYNRYFDEIVGQISLFQFEDTTTSFSILPASKMKKNMKVDLINLYPLSIQALPSNWADEGYHKINMSFFFESFNISNTSV